MPALPIRPDLDQLCRQATELLRGPPGCSWQHRRSPNTASRRRLFWGRRASARGDRTRPGASQKASDSAATMQSKTRGAPHRFRYH